MNLYRLGVLLGWLIVISYVLTISNYWLKFANRRYFSKLAKDSPGRLAFQKVSRFFFKYHFIFGFITAAAMIAHFILQFLNWGPVYTGIITAALLVIQVSLGAFVQFKQKKKAGAWLYIHRVNAVLLFIMVAVHVIAVNYL